MDVAVVGTGYVGLVSGVCLAEKGHRVVCVDQDASKVSAIESGRSPIYEEGLQELLERNLGRRLRATRDLFEAIETSDLSLIAVGTPFDGQSIDVSHVRAASAEIGRALRTRDSFHSVVVKSTVVPGTSDQVVRPVLEQESGKRAGEGFGVGMNPEFLREGVAVSDFMNPDRIVYGGSDERTLAALDELYAVFESADKIRTSNKTAEMIKYASNSLLATLISFSNEVGNLCAALGDIDVVDVMKGVHLDRRLSPVLEDGRRIVPAVTTYLEAGCGFGGSCFPKDVKALIAHGEQAGQGMDLLRSVIRINEAQPERLIELLNKHFASLRDRRIAVLGLAFKPGTSDMRESPSIPLIQTLHREGASIAAFDPVACEEAKRAFGGLPVDYAASLEQAIEGADAIVIVTIWDQFADLPELIARLEPPPLVVDGRRMLDKHAVLRYEGIGL